MLGAALQKQGRLVAVGYAGHNMPAVRAGENGSRGSRFRAGRGVANAVVVQRDGKIVFAGDQRPDLRITNAPIGQIGRAHV